MDRDLRNNTLISNIAGNFVRAGQHRPLVSPTGAVLKAQETSLANSLMEAKANRMKTEDATASQEAAYLAIATPKVNAILGRADPDVQKVLAELRAADPLDLTGAVARYTADTKLINDQQKMKWEKAEAEREANASPYTPGAQLFMDKPEVFTAMQAATSRPSTNVNVSVSASPEELAEQAAINEAYKRNTMGEFASDEEFLTHLESLGPQGKKDAEDMAKRAKLTGEIELNKRKLADLEAGKDVTRQREGVAASTVVDDLNDAMKIMEDYGYTASGTLGAITRWIAETPAGKVKDYVNSVKSNIGIDTLLKIKKEGSGLGQVPQRQLEELQKVLGPLSYKADAKILYQTMKEVKRLYAAVEARMTPEDRKLVGLPSKKGSDAAAPKTESAAQGWSFEFIGP